MQSYAMRVNKRLSGARMYAVSGKFKKDHRIL